MNDYFHLGKILLTHLWYAIAVSVLGVLDWFLPKKKNK